MAITIDGKLDASGYSLGYEFDFVSDTGGVYSGARIYFGTDTTSGNHFMYYALPKSYVDNSYGDNGIGWDHITAKGNKPAGHSFFLQRQNEVGFNNILINQ